MSEPAPAGPPEPVVDPWSVDVEVPAADAEEQRRAVVVDPEETDPETAAGRDTTGRLADPPLEVSEFDLAEQSIEVPLDDDEFDRG